MRPEMLLSICYATSGAMIAAFYDRGGYNSLYTGPTDYGRMPSDNSGWAEFTDIEPATYRVTPLSGTVGPGSYNVAVNKAGNTYTLTATGSVQIRSSLPGIWGTRERPCAISSSVIPATLAIPAAARAFSTLKRPRRGRFTAA